jgi:hypothetical protein
MHEPAPIPPDPESERRGHELRDVAIRPILYFLIGLFVFGGVLQAVMTAIMNGYVVEDTKVGVPAATVEEFRKDQKTILESWLRDKGDVGDNVHPGNPAPLQRDTTGDMLRMYAEEDATLYSYGFDKKSGRYHIPVKQAMKTVVAKGLLKHRETAPKSGIDPELPYPMRTEPYKATP